MVFIGGLLAILATAALSEQPAPTEELRFQGRPVSEWRERMKGLDPSGPQAAENVPPLIELIQSESIPEFTRRQAAITLGRIGKPAADAVPVLRQLLAETDSDSTRLWILKAFTLFGGTAGAASSEVAQFVRDADQTHLIRVAAIEALCRMGPQHPQVMQTLLDGVRGNLDTRNAVSRRELQMAAAEVLGLLGADAAPALPDLIRAAESDWDLLRLSAVTTLGHIGPQSEIAIPALADVILFDDAPEVRDAAAVSLGAIGTAAVPTLTQLASVRDPEVRERALIGAIAIGPVGVPVLKFLLDDADLELRIRAADQLISRDETSRRAATVLLLGMTVAPPRQQRTAYMALRQHPSAWSPADTEFQQLLHHTDPRLRQLAERLQRERPASSIPSE